MASSRIHRILANLAVFATSILLMLAAVLVLYATVKVRWFATHPASLKIAEEIAAVVFVTGLISIAWELRARRAIVAEVLAAAGLSERIERAGVADVTADFLGDVDWKELFERTRELDIFFAYGGSWRGNQIERIRAVNRRNGARIRVVLPDPDDQDTVRELARRFGTTADVVVHRIRESIDSFKELAQSADAKAHLEIRVWRRHRCTATTASMTLRSSRFTTTKGFARPCRPCN